MKFKAIESWATAAITISRSPFSSAEANCSAYPFYFTATITISRSPFSSAEAYRSARPFCFTASITPARAMGLSFASSRHTRNS